MDIEKLCDLKLNTIKKLDERADWEAFSGKTMIMFDYDERNPLNYEAMAYRLEAE